GEVHHERRQVVLDDVRRPAEQQAEDVLRLVEQREGEAVLLVVPAGGVEIAAEQARDRAAGGAAESLGGIDQLADAGQAGLQLVESAVERVALEAEVLVREIGAGDVAEIVPALLEDDEVAEIDDQRLDVVRSEERR